MFAMQSAGDKLAAMPCPPQLQDIANGCSQLRLAGEPVAAGVRQLSHVTSPHRLAALLDIAEVHEHREQPVAAVVDALVVEEVVEVRVAA